MISARSESDPPTRLYGTLCDSNPEALVCRGFEAAYLGYTVGSRCVAIYDYDMCIDIVLAQGDITKDDAIAYFFYNTLSKCHGENSPIFMRGQ